MNLQNFMENLIILIQRKINIFIAKICLKIIQDTLIQGQGIITELLLIWTLVAYQVSGILWEKQESRNIEYVYQGYNNTYTCGNCTIDKEFQYGII